MQVSVFVAYLRSTSKDLEHILNIPRRAAYVFGTVLPCVTVPLRVTSNSRYGITCWGARHMSSGQGLRDQHVTKYLLMVISFRGKLPWPGLEEPVGERRASATRGPVCV